MDVGSSFRAEVGKKEHFRPPSDEKDIIISSQSSFSVAGGGGGILFTDHEEWEDRMPCLPFYRQ